MSTIVTCECGVKVRLPELSSGQAFCCPKCKANLLVGADKAADGEPRIRASDLAQGADVGRTCPICQSPIAAEEVVLTCSECDQVHHRECWAEVGGCSTYGCKQAPSLNKEDPAASPPRAAWGDNKTCPACGETIKAIALRCRYCGTDFDTVDPLTVHDLRGQVQRDEINRSLQASTIVLFGLSLVGLLAPILAPIGLIWVLRRRKDLAKLGPVYLILGYSSVALSLLYSGLMLLFWLFSES